MGESKARKILLVDDDPAVAFITQKLLSKAKVETDMLLARHGAEALSMLREACRREQCPELILLDIQMPVMDGFEFLEELRKSADLSTAALRIVLLSSSRHHLDVAKAKEYPVVDFIQKPLTLEKLSGFL